MRLRWPQRRLLDRFATPRGTLLDIGCGPGMFVKAATELGYHASGIDFSGPMIGIARRSFGLTSVHQIDLEGFTAECRRSHTRYDVVTAFEVLEHQSSVHTFMNSVVTLLKPGGLLALSVPNRDRWPDKGLYKPGLWDRPPHHLTRWNGRSLRYLCRKWGFTAVTIEAEPLSTTWVGGSLREILGVNALGRHLFALLRRRSRLREDDLDAPIMLDPAGFRLATIIQWALLPLVLVCTTGLRLIGETGVRILLLARLADTDRLRRLGW
jgi:SAM-dependent methyltransferase